MNAEQQQLVRKRPSFLHALAAPWVYVFLPRRAAAAMAAAGRWSFVCAHFGNMLLLAGTIIALAIADKTYDYIWHQPPATTNPTTMSYYNWTGEWEYRTVVEVWRAWHSGSTPWWGPAESILLLTLVLGTLCVAVLAWLHLFRVHRRGAVWPSFRLSFRVVSASSAVVILSILLWYGGYILDERDLLFSSSHYAGLTAALFIPANCWLYVFWLGRAVAGVEDESLDLGLPLRCEGCGYDLTHRPVDGRCSECGLVVDISLTPELRRPGSAWMRRRCWLISAVRVLFSPRRFYEELQLRTPGSTERGFAGWNFLGMFVGALVWAGVLVAGIERFQGLGPDIDLELLVVIAVAALGFALGCWLLHRTIAALVVSFWMFRRRLPDYRWAAKVMAYESVTLWLPAVYLGLLMMSFIIYEDWVSALFGRNFPASVFLGMPGEVLAAFCGPVAYVLLAFWRYRIICRAIRWSNF